MFEILKDVRKLLTRKQKLTIIFVFISMLFVALLEMVGVALIVPIVTLLLDNEQLDSIPFVRKLTGLIQINNENFFFLIVAIAVSSFFIIKSIYLYYQFRFQTTFLLKGKYSLQEKVLHNYLSRRYDFFLFADSGDIIRSINTDTNNFFVILQCLLSILVEFLICIAILISVLVVNLTAGIVILSLGIFIICFLYLLGKKKLSASGKKLVYAMSKAYKWLLQSIEGVKTVKVMHKEVYFEEQYTKNNEDWFVVERNNNLFGKMPVLFVEGLIVCVLMSFLVIVKYLNFDITKILSVLSVLTVSIIKIVPSIGKISISINNINYYKYSLGQLTKTLDEQEKYKMNIERCPSGRTFTFNKDIDFSGVVFKYPHTDKLILDNASFRVKKGMSIGIIGKSGSGKTTTVDILLGLLEPIFGEIKVDDVNIKENYFNWLSHVGYISQNIFLLDDTIKENIVFGNTNIDDKQVWKSLKAAQIDDFVESLPLKLNTEVGERGVRLSGGQRQRLGIARALYSNPDILVFDEATSSLDVQTERNFMNVVEKLHGDKTLIIITHRLSTIENCDVIYEVKDGKIIEKQGNDLKSS